MHQRATPHPNIVFCIVTVAFSVYPLFPSGMPSILCYFWPMHSLSLQEKPDMLLASEGLAPLLTREAKFIQQHLHPFLWNLLRGRKPARLNNTQQFSFPMDPLYRSPWADTSHCAPRGIFFQDDKAKPLTGQPAQSSENETPGLAFPGSHSHFTFKTSASLKRYATGLLCTAQENIFMYVYIYKNTNAHIHVHSLCKAMLIQHSQLFHNPQPSKQSGQANLITNLLHHKIITN